MTPKLLNRVEVQISLIYVLLAVIWIVTSDTLLFRFVPQDSSLLTLVNYGKGVGFVLVTGGGLYLLLRREFRRRDRISQSLQISEDRLRRAVADAPIPIMIFAEDGEILTISDAWCDITGYTAEQLRTLDDWTTLAYGERRSVVQVGIDSLFELQEHVNEGEFSIRCRDGSERIWEFRSSALKPLPDGRRAAISMATDVTDRKQAEEASRAQERSFRLLFESNPHCMWVYDLETLAFFEVNKAAVEHYGYSRDEFLSMTIIDIRPQTDHERLRADVSQERPALQHSGVWQHRLKDGQIIDVEITSHLLEYAGRAAALVVAQDVTQRQRMRQELYRANQYLQTLIQASPLGITVFDPEGIVQFWNPAAEQILGWSQDEVVGRLLPYVREQDRAQFDYLRSRVAEGETFTGIEVERERKNGSTINLSISAGPLYDDDSKHTGVIGIIQDITERKRAEAALRESEERFRELAEHIREVFFLIDAHKRQMLYISPAYEMVWGRSCESLYEDPSSFLQGIHPDDRERVIATFDQQRQGLPVTIEYRVVRSDQSVRWIRSRTFPVLDTDGTFERTAGLAEDITHIREQENKLKQLAQQLVHIQEMERRDIARELHDEIGQTLTGLSLSLEMLFRGQPPEQQADAATIQEIVNTLMKRVREMSLDLRPAMLDDLGLLAALRWLLKRYTDRTGIKVEFRQSGMARRFTTEVETAVYRTVQESLTNVARHAGVHTVTVDLLANSGKIIIQVEDRGQGFDVEEASSGMSTAGLIGMRERAFILGGNLIIDSTVGRGTLVMVELPLCIEKTGRES